MLSNLKKITCAQPARLVRSSGARPDDVQFNTSSRTSITGRLSKLANHLMRIQFDADLLVDEFNLELSRVPAGVLLEAMINDIAQCGKC